ncbi:HAMP domain-containing sensor histidine kinase [Dactylosporangium sp. AC04546]|uniref:sensor histidine kinase n=1 Tax=Dactylosporangium sp. AC04546 TaxID=2862460 RepID=UPI001EDD7FDB|nr:HAMP domain-containing sensor histidine kinase [Dactylosporangium sp. AC04546]WVK82747.1 HAMP domain-containing sensor histidine kinase [Dactylosporangium sp. AC04546]
MNRMTIRTRLTLVYGALVLVAGLALLGITYLLVYARLQNAFVFAGTRAGGEAPPPDLLTERKFVADIQGDVKNSALQAFLTQGGIALGVVLIAAVAFSWLIAGRLLQPLHRVTETARRIAAAPDRGLHERIALDGPYDEVKELADTFDGMLARLDKSFDGQRRFIANASHELRTPLTLNRTLLEVATDPATASPELVQLGRTLLAVNDRHERLIDGLLLLARSERPVTERAYVDLADVVGHVVGQVPPGSVKVEAAAGEAPTLGNAVLLERVVHNLVENGVRHNLPEHGWVRAESGTRPDGTAFVRVSNSGPVVPRYEIPNLFEPFRRLGAERAKAPGAGLGLSIVRAVVLAHGGGVQADPRDGGGLIVTVILPTATLGSEYPT